ncbi:MAG: type II toxin-antitoxin system prevent-host-death family antitoxin [bacterium]
MSNDNDVYDVAAAGAKLSALISEVEHQQKKVFITRQGKNIAVIIPFEEFINQQSREQAKNGFCLAQGDLADMNTEDFDRFLDDIYQAREEAFERKVDIDM